MPTSRASRGRMHRPCSVTPCPRRCSETPMPIEARTEIHVDTPVGPVRGSVTDGVVHAGGRPGPQAGRGGARRPITWTEPLDATQPGAAPPQVVGGLDLVPGMTPSRQA